MDGKVSGRSYKCWLSRWGTLNEDKSVIEKLNILSGGYGLMPRIIARDRWLTVGARMLYSYLTSLQEWWNMFPSRDLICYELDISKTHLQSTKELEMSGYIKGS